MRRAKWIAVAGVGLALTACATRKFNPKGTQEGSLESLKGAVKKDKFGRPVVDRFYLANLYSTETINGGKALLGDALIYGIACFDEPLDDNQMVNVPDKPLTQSGAHIVYREKPLKSRTYVHEFAPFFSPNEWASKPDGAEGTVAPRIEDLRRPGICRVIYGTEKPAWGADKSPIDRNEIEKLMMEKLSSTIGTCGAAAGNTVLAAAAVTAMVATGAAAFPGAPVVLTAGAMISPIFGTFSCKPALSAFVRESTIFHNKVAQSVFNDAWNEAGKVATTAVETDFALKVRIEDAEKAGDKLTVAALFNPQFVKAFNGSVNGDMNLRGGWFNLAKTLTSDKFFTYILELENDVGIQFANQARK